MIKKSLLGACAAIVLLPAAAAHADVTLEVAGSNGTLLPQTSTANTGADVAKDGTHACSGGSVAGALERTTGGKWTGTYGSFGYSVDAIEGEAHAFSSGAYWGLYVNGKVSQTGACDTTLQTGDRIQWFPVCADPTNTAGCYNDPLQLSVPATVKPGVAFTATVTQTTTTTDADFNSTSVVGPASGASAGGQTAGSDGKATVTIATRGPQTVTATKPGLAPSTASVCVTDGADGFCGTTKPGAAPAPAATTPAPAPYTGPVAAKVTFAKEGEKFAKGKGPRTISGTVAVPPAGLKDVRIRLSRTNDGDCTAYDAKREKFVTQKKCGAANATFFSIGDRADWSYLLPSKLGKGRYVLDVRAIDATGKADTTLQRGRNRIVFTVS